MELWRKLADTQPLRRLQSVGMNCGMEYTRFEPYLHGKRNTRFAHSMGVAEIVWQFTGDEKQAAAGLLHDVSTPVFAHVVDFLNGDAMTQESTEAGTREIIEGSAEIQRILGDMGLCTGDVCDYHRYPLADNPSPRLSADRLDYTLRNLVTFRLCPAEQVRALYGDLTVEQNEFGEPELAFRTEACVRRFARLTLMTSRLYVAESDRYSMQYLAEILALAIRRGTLSRADLYTTEPQVIAALEGDPETASLWRRFRGFSSMEVSETRPEGGDWRQVPAKKRSIDPILRGRGRISMWDAEYCEALQAFREERQEAWLRAR